MKVYKRFRSFDMQMMSALAYFQLIWLRAEDGRWEQEWELVKKTLFHSRLLQYLTSRSFKEENY